jgi:hypothetical protein
MAVKLKRSRLRVSRWLLGTCWGKRCVRHFDEPAAAARIECANAGGKLRVQIDIKDYPRVGWMLECAKNCAGNWRFGHLF